VVPTGKIESFGINVTLSPIKSGPCGICCGRNGIGIGFFSEYFGFPFSPSFHCGSIFMSLIYHRRYIILAFGSAVI